MSAQTPMCVAPTAGDVWQLFGDTYICKVPAEATSGTYAVFEQVVRPGNGIPLHRHNETDELIYILEGSLRIRCAEDSFLGESGTIVSVPKGTPHALHNDSDHDCRLLATVVPGRFINFLRDVANLPESERMDRSIVPAIYARYESELLE